MVAFPACHWSLQCSLALYPVCCLGGVTNKPNCSFHDTLCALLRVRWTVSTKQTRGDPSFLPWRVHSDSEVTSIPYILTLYFILFYFFQVSPEGLIIRRALWREKEDHCPYHLLPESGRVIGLCEAKWSQADGCWLKIDSATSKRSWRWKCWSLPSPRDPAPFLLFNLERFFLNKIISLESILPWQHGKMSISMPILYEKKGGFC